MPDFRHFMLPPQPWEVEAASSVGFTISMFRFAVSFLASIVVGIVFRYIPTPRSRHWYAALTGFALIYYPFGNGCFHALAPSLLTYLFMARFRKHCGTLTWLVAFPYLIANHVMQQSGTAWQLGHLDFTAAQMVLTLKLISVAMCYQDGARPEADLREYARAKRLADMPSLLEYFSYLFSAGNLLAGPVFEARDYFDYAERRGEWDQSDPAQRLPSPLAPGAARFGKAMACTAVWFALTRYGFEPGLFQQPWYRTDFPLVKRAFMVWACVVVYRFKYYGVWAVAECSLIFSGMGYEGRDAAGHPRWGRYTNARVRGVELNPSLADTPRHWNICTGNWLRHYVYERLVPPGGKPGFGSMVLTQLVSGVWHGLFPGYWLFFLTSAFMFQASRVLYRYEQSWAPALRAFPPWVLLKVVATALVLDYAGVAFLVLSWEGTLQAWRAVYFFGHAVVGLLLVVGAVMPPRGGKRRARLAPESAVTVAAGAVGGEPTGRDEGKVDGKAE